MSMFAAMLKRRIVPVFEQLQPFIIQFIITNPVEDRYESLFVLPVDLIKLNKYRRIFPDHKAIEKIGATVKFFEEAPLGFLYNRWQLKHISDKQHLYAAESFMVFATDMTKHDIHGIQHIATHHTYFINDEQLKLLYHLFLF